MGGEYGARLQPLLNALAAELRRHAVLRADETPVAMLKPGLGKAHRAHLRKRCITDFNNTKAVVFEFAESRSGKNVRGRLIGQGRRPISDQERQSGTPGLAWLQNANRELRSCA
jgi:hypothetical protein